MAYAEKPNQSRQSKTINYEKTNETAINTISSYYHAICM